MRAIRVLVVDDSPFIRKALLRIFETDAAIEVVGTARDGAEAIRKVQALNPDVVTLDILMPETDGIEALKTIMEIHPVPVVMLSQLTKDGAELTLRALELGAMDFVDKSSTGYMDFFDLANEIVLKVKTLASGKPVRMQGRPRGEAPSGSRGLIDVVSIGASTGGPPALQMLLRKFPRDIGFGILVVQHMPHGFTEPLAKRLDSLCEIRVKEAEDGDRIEPGVALIAPSGLHMTVNNSHHAGIETRGRVRLEVEPLRTLHRPSVDVLFTSVAKSFANRALAVILTGMGSDGARGMAAIKETGGTALAQDEATSVIYGMPKAAVECGAVDKVVSIVDMADEILKRA